MQYDTLEATVDEILDRPALRACGVRVAESGLVSWDHGEEWFTPKRATRANPERKSVLRTRTSSGLLGLMGESNCAAANSCSRSYLAAVLLAIAQQPFPLGSGEAVFRACLAAVEAGYLMLVDARLLGIHICHTATHSWLLQLDEAFPQLGDLRAAIVRKAGGGCNAPTDGYLRIAAHIARGEDVPPEARY